MEIWKDVIGYEGLYKVSNYGNVLSCERVIKNNYGSYIKKESIMKTSPDRCGYKIACLRKDGIEIHKSVHRLVALSFLPNEENKPCVNHINGIKHDNRLENLEWCTYYENNIHAIRTGLIKPGNKKGDKNSRARKIVDTKTNIIYTTIKEAALLFNIDPSYLTRMLKNKANNWTNFKYID